MNKPNYSSYTLEELIEALNSIDKEMYPKRVQLIQMEIDKLRFKNNTIIEKDDSINSNKDINVEQLIYPYVKMSIVLLIVSFLFGTSVFIYYITDLIYPEFSYSFTFSVPGFVNSPQLLKIVVLLTITIFFHSSLVIGSIGSYFNKKFFYLLGITWGLWSFGFQIWEFKWWPGIYYDKSFFFKFDLFGIILGMKFNLVPCFLFLWSLSNIAEFKKEFFNLFK